MTARPPSEMTERTGAAISEVERVGTDGVEIPLVTGHRSLRSAARDWATYTSNTPFRVPIPEESGLRDVRQLPIETDPPEHRAYRDLIEERFNRGAADRIRPVIADLAAAKLTLGRSSGSIGVVGDLAVPIVATAIAETLGRPEDSDRIAFWGVHVFNDPDTGRRRRNRDVDAYLEQRVDAALAGGADDLFGDLTRAEVFGRGVTREEMLGFGSLVLAGGRDTVISSIVGALWFLATHRGERQRLRDDPGLVPVAVEELLRYFSPLPLIGRTVTAHHDLHGCPLSTGDLIGLGFAAANHDPRAFDAPDRVDLDRRPNRHVAFGHGPHTCIGAALARMETAVVIEQFLAIAPEGVTASEPWSDRPDSATLSTAWIPGGLRLAMAD